MVSQPIELRDAYTAVHSVELYGAIKRVSEYRSFDDLPDCEMYGDLKLLNCLVSDNPTLAFALGIPAIILLSSEVLLTADGQVRMGTFIKLKELGFNIHKLSDDAYFPFNFLITNVKVGIMFKS